MKIPSTRTYLERVRMMTKLNETAKKRITTNMAEKAAATAITGQSELELVERVFLKIVLAETDDQFGTSVNGFLAPILLKLSTPNEQVKNKILELLTHINRRLKSRTGIELPVETLLDQYCDDKVPASVRNFTIIYIKMGYQRASNATQIKLMPKMFKSLRGRPTQHQNAILINILYHLNKLQYPDNLEERLKLFPFVKDKQLVHFVLDFFMDFLLLPYNLDLNMNDPAVLPPPSLSRVSFSRLRADPLMTKDEVETAKLAILKFLHSDLLPAVDVISHFIAASSDMKHNIADKGEHGVKTLASSDLWEDKNVVNKLLKLYKGTQVNQGNLNETVHADNIRLPSSVRLKLKIFPYILKSKIIVDLNPPICLQIIFEGLFGDNHHAKIRHFCLEFIHHICWFCSDKTLSFMGPLFHQALSRVSLDKKEDPKLRSLAFSGFSKIARRAPFIFTKDITLIQKLILLLEEEDADVRLSIQNAIATIAPVFSGVTGMNIKIMESLLLNCIESGSPQVRLAGVQIANGVFPSTHVPSRYALILMSGDSKDDAREEAIRGLSPKDDSDNIHYPDYSELCDYLYGKIIDGKSKINPDSYVLSSSVAMQMMSFINKCLYGKCGITEEDEPHESLKKLQKFFGSLTKECTANEEIWKTSVGRHLSLLIYSLHPSAEYIVHSKTLGFLLPIIASSPDRLPALLFDSFHSIKASLYSSKEEIRESAAQLTSIILCSRSPKEILKEVKYLLQNASSQQKFEETHGEVLCIAYALSRYFHTKRTLHVNDMESDSAEDNEELDIDELVKQALGYFYTQLKGTNVALFCACCVAIGELARSCVLPIPDSLEDKDEILSKKSLVTRLATILKDAPEVKLKEKSALALRSFCLGDVSFVHREQIIQTFIDGSKLRHMELQFTIGEGFSCLGAGKESKISREKYLLEDHNDIKMEVDANAENTTITDSPEEAKTDLMSPLIEKIIRECISSPVAHVRQAGVIWLVCIVKYSGHHFAVQNRITDVQLAFVNSLSDSDELTQDIASRGLGLVYDHIRKENKKEVISILMERLTSGKRVKQDVNDDTKLFEPGMLGKAPEGGNLSTYKELCSLATSLNKPDLMYKFMSLANHQALWNSKKGAALGFFNIASLAGDELKPYLGEIIPKLYRYQYDPNLGIRRAMSNIWSVVAPDGKKTVDKYVNEIMEDLLSNITNNVWRTRESCCLALCDLINTSPGENIVSYLPTIWEITFKVLDDIKESVRKAATSLAKTLNKISVRLCDFNHSKLGSKAITEVLPVLLEVGLSSRVAEVKSLSLETLVAVSKNAGALLKPHIPVFVIALLESLSGLESEYLNTLSLQLSQSQEAQDKLDLIRVSASKTSPMMTAVNFCVLHVDGGVLPGLVPRLCDLLKTGLGVGTKAGCATFVISITLHCKEEITPYAGKLLAALLHGLSGHNAYIKKAYSASIGHLIRYAKDSSIEKLLARLKKWYFEKEDESLHLSCANCLSSMARYSPDKFYQFNSIALPLVFLAMQGEVVVGSTDTEHVWTDIWNNNTSGNISAIKLYLPDIHELIEPLFKSASWGLREKAAKATLSIADALGSSLQQPHLKKLVRLLLDVIPGRLWTGKETLLKALSKIYVKCSQNIQEHKEDMPSLNEVTAALLKECKKDNVEYRLSAIECFTGVVEVWEEDKFEEFHPVFMAVFEPKEDEDGDEDMDRKSKNNVENLKCTTCEALGILWPRSKEAQEKHFEYMSTTILDNLTNSTWKMQQSVLKAAVKIIARTHWLEACSCWKNISDSYVGDSFLEKLIPSVCLCIETSTYSSVKLNALKTLKELYTVSKESKCVSAILKKYSGKLLALVKNIDQKSSFDMSKNASDLIELVNLVTME